MSNLNNNYKKDMVIQYNKEINKQIVNKFQNDYCMGNNAIKNKHIAINLKYIELYFILSIQT